MTLNTEHWHEERSIEVLGTLVIRNSIVDYGCMIYIRNSNESIIEGNQILHYYYGIFSSHSTPTIKDNVISPFIGNGIFLWHSSPVIENTIIETYIGTGISIYYSSPIIKNSYVRGGSNDFYISGDSHPIVSNTTFDSSMVHIADEHSSLLVGTLGSEDGSSGGSSEESTGSGVDPVTWGVIVMFTFIVFTVAMRKTSIQTKSNGRGSANGRSGTRSTSRRKGTRSGSRNRKRK
jgi:parallel beta-helix repeat protein